MNRPIVVTGIGTNVGKTLAAAIVTVALKADYWKPVQAGIEDGTDTLTVSDWLGTTTSSVHQELYKLNMPASPHIASRKENIVIEGSSIVLKAKDILNSLGEKQLIIEGAGGLLVPLNKDYTIANLIKDLNARVMLVSRNYLGSINHSLLTAHYCLTNNIDVIGWVFNDQYLDYEQEIVQWSGYPTIMKLPFIDQLNHSIIQSLAAANQSSILQYCRHESI